ncbi:FapA family protein [Desulfospira joergensenii]|uniref:FapA family protein n=1 Tax=Desulfospira joergensenii TaxID=53329 RepID=UPI001376ECC9|nr:FapA family protein [Desulfospira joergensenii]
MKNLLISKAELEKGLSACAGSKDPEADLKAYFLSNEMISTKNMDRLARMAKTLEIRRKEILFGSMAVRLGFINQSVADLALEEQEEDIKSQKRPIRIGDMMVISGFMTERQRDYILKLQKRERREISLPQETPVPDPGKEKESVKKEDGKKSLPETLLEPEIITGGIKLQVSGDMMAAFLTKTPEFNEDVTVGEIKDALFEREIVFGLVKDDLIQGFINSSGFKTQSFRVARGIKPVEGKDAKIEFFFNTDYLQAGGLDSEGNIDFKQRGDVPHVEEGTVLAEKTPCVEARHGQNIYGNQVATETGTNHPLKFGKGAKLSEDGLKVLAAVTGFPKYSLSGNVYVHQEYTTGGDVDYETGHIDYDGNVNVKGCIKSGFQVKGNDIQSIELDGGKVEADGNLTVTGGIVEGKVYAKGDVNAKFVRKSEIVCMGNVIVSKEIVDSTIICSGSLILENGKIISSVATAKMGVFARHVGSETASPCRIKVGHDAFVERELKKINVQIDEIKGKIKDCNNKKEVMLQENKELQLEITRLAHIQDRSQLEQEEIGGKIASLEGKSGLGNTIEELRQQMDELKKNADTAEKDLDNCFDRTESVENGIEVLEKKIKELEDLEEEKKLEKKNLIQWTKENKSNPVVRVEGALQPGTHIQGSQSEIKVKNLIRHARIAETKEDGAGGGIYQMQVVNF